LLFINKLCLNKENEHWLICQNLERLSDILVKSILTITYTVIFNLIILTSNREVISIITHQAFLLCTDL
jgi:hypothetical protein